MKRNMVIIRAQAKFQDLGEFLQQFLSPTTLRKPQVWLFFLLPAISLSLPGCETPKENFAFEETKQLTSCGGMSVRPSEGTDAEKLERMLAMYADYRRSAFPSVAEISAEETKIALENGTAIIVDTRLDAERSISTIPGAISKQEFERNADSFRSKIVVNYCTIGYRSGIYTRKLKNRGFNAKNLKGSILAWAHAGFDFQVNGETTKCAHVYGEDWNLLPTGFKPVW